MSGLEDQFEIDKLSAEERFIQETIYDCEYIKPDADNAIEYSTVMLNDVYYPIRLSTQYKSFEAMWTLYARFGQAESVEPGGFKKRSGMPSAFGSGEISYGIEKLKNAIAILSQKETLNDKIKNETIRSVILGVPGSGKSMFCARLALACAKEEYDIKRFAVMLKCRTLRSKVINCRNSFEHIAYEMSSTGLNTKEFITLMNNHAEKGDLLLIIDGFDELNKQNKTLVFQTLRDYLNKEEYSHVSMIMTGRTQAYDKEIKEEINSINDISFHYVQRMTKQDKNFFIGQWLYSLNGKNAVDGPFINSALEELELYTDETIKDLSEIPLYLSNMLEIKRFEGHIPQNIAKYNESFLRKFEHRVHDDNIHDYPYEVIIKYIAYSMTFDGENRKIVINSDELQHLIEKCCNVFPYSFNDYIDENESEYIMNVLVNDMAIFRPVISHRGHDLGFQFMHLSVQELLTAKAIITHTTPDKSGAIEFFHDYFNKNYSPLDKEQFYYLIAKDLLRLSDELRNSESREIEKMLIEKKCTLLLDDKIMENMTIFYPRQVMMLYFEGEDHTPSLWRIMSLINYRPEYRVYIKELAIEMIQDTKNAKYAVWLNDIIERIDIQEAAKKIASLLDDKAAFTNALLNYISKIRSIAIDCLLETEDRDDYIMLNRIIERINRLNRFDVINERIDSLIKEGAALIILNLLTTIHILLCERFDSHDDYDGDDDWDVYASSDRINLIAKYLADIEGLVFKYRCFE